MDHPEAEMMIEGVVLGMLRYHFASTRLDNLDLLK
jgi:hypothetical protein